VLIDLEDGKNVTCCALARMLRRPAAGLRVILGGAAVV